jgi:hypothetical protein
MSSLSPQDVRRDRGRRRTDQEVGLVDRRSALDVLGLEHDVDLAGLKRRFRALARDLHPDRGGDPSAFLTLQAAYEVVSASLADTTGSVPAPRVARGRPSRSDDAAGSARRLDEHRLDAAADALARRLASTGSTRWVSRAPGSRLNPLAASLALGASSLEARLVRPGAADPSWTARIRLTVRSRGARRALAALDLSSIIGTTWTRHRGDGVTVLEAQVTATEMGMATRRAAAATAGMLAALAWPLDAWHSV